MATYAITYGDRTVTYTYTYDDNGNILSVYDDWSQNTDSYVYDSANQLIRENNQYWNSTRTWEYDNAGNITSRKEYAYTTGDLTGLTTTGGGSYTYGDEDWGDLLTEYQGNDFDYDEIGNLIHDGDREYAWEHGRQLSRIFRGTDGWSFDYNADGMRTMRTNGTTTYEYTYNGSQLTQMTVDTDGDDEVDITLAFTYDANGTPLTLTDGSDVYYYITNLQGDVIALHSITGSTALYTYDAWGVCRCDAFTNIEFYNPLRYRGYVYDEDTGLYYLQSRYYDPEIGRFINADSLISTGQGILGNNMFAYCGNNPVVHSDPAGHMRKHADITRGTIGGAALGALLLPAFVGAVGTAVQAMSKAMSEVATFVQTQVQAQLKKLEERAYSVYFLKPEGGKDDDIVYVGRVVTANMSSRMSYHRKMGREKVASIDNLTFMECRVLEQAGMAYYHTIHRGNLLNNQIRGISLAKGGQYLGAAIAFAQSMRDIYAYECILPLSYIENQAENWLLNAMP